MPGQFRAGDPLENALDQAIAEHGEMRRVLRQIALGDAHGLGEPDDAGDVFRPGAAVALVPAPVLLRLQPHAGGPAEATPALRAVELARRHGEEVDTNRTDAHRDLS